MPRAAAGAVTRCGFAGTGQVALGSGRTAITAKAITKTPPDFPYLALPPNTVRLAMSGRSACAAGIDVVGAQGFEPWTR